MRVLNSDTLEKVAQYNIDYQKKDNHKGHRFKGGDHKLKGHLGQQKRS